MAKFAPVCPVRILEKLEPTNAGDYHLLLAHDVAPNAESYRKYFGKYRNFTIIMDNSVIETGNAVDLKVIKKACDAVDVTTIVLPDVLLDGKATVESCSAAIVDWRVQFRDYIGNNQQRGFMYVPQGKTLQEWAWSAQALANDPSINFWGIPRNMVAEGMDRRDAISIAYSLNPNRRIHLLGFSDDIPHDVLSAQDRRVEGIDSAVPMRVTSPITFMSDPGKRGTWWDEVQHDPIMDYNIATYKKWIRRV